MFPNKGVVGQLGVRPRDAGDFVRLSGRETLIRIKAPNSVQESLASEHFMDSGDASCETMFDVKQRRVRVRERRSFVEQRPGNRSNVSI